MTNKEIDLMKIQNFIDVCGDDYDSLKDLIEAYNLINSKDDLESEFNFIETDQIKAMNLLDEAWETDSYLDFVTKISQAYELDPDNLDIVSEYILIEEDMWQAHEKLASIADQFYNDNKNTIKESSYNNIDNRPYFRLKHRLVEFYKNNFLFAQAEKHCKDILKQNESDNLGARYALMSIYIHSNQHSKARKFYKSDQLYKNSDMMVFYMLISAILDGQDKYALDLTEKLLDLNEDFTLIFQDSEFNYNWIYIGNRDSYKPYTYESLSIVINDLDYIIARSDYLYNKIRNNIITISPQAIPWPIAKKSVESILREAKVYDLLEEKIFSDISTAYIRPLVMEGLETLEDFEKVTKDQVLAIDGIGPATVKKLEKNGVKFKDQ